MSEKRVDEEWKRRAREEKKTLAREGEGGARGEASQPSFALIVSSFVAQALIALGQIQSPVDGQRKLDLDGAKFAIDLLQVLADKTKGNLADDEKKMLEDALYDLRMHYVEISNRIGPGIG